MSTGTHKVDHLTYEERRLENKLDKMLGFYYWRTYWATSLWANLSTPINLCITIFTALMTVHSSGGTSSFISDELNMKINVCTFFVSILNTFFTPQKRFTELNDYLVNWSNFGFRFEKAIFKTSAKEDKIKEYLDILEECNKLHTDQFSKHRSFITDFLHLLVRVVFMGSNDRWMKESGNYSFYQKIKDANIDLDFDLEQLKDYQTKSSTFRKICACFSCLFPEKQSVPPKPQPQPQPQPIQTQKSEEFHTNPLAQPSIELTNIGLVK